LKLGNCSQFYFFSTEKPLDAEQRLIEVVNLIRAIRIPDDNQMEVAKIQLKDVAKTWWLMEEARLEKPITLDQFSKDFYERFFPVTVQKEMEE